MKRLQILIVTIFYCLIVWAAPVQYVSCSPSDGASVSAFSFTLTFDISDAVASLGNGEWGLGYGGDEDSHYTTLYEGTQDSGKELSKIMTSNFNGKSEGFKVNGNTINIDFPNTIIPLEGQLYTLVIRNNFSLYQNGKIVPKTTTTLKFEENPLVLSFIGKASGTNTLSLQALSIADNASLELIKDVTYTFNAPISVNSDFKTQIKEGEVIIAEANSMTIEDGNTLVGDFGKEIPLSFGHTYNICLPEGAVSLASDATKVNKTYSVNITGAKTYTYAAASVSPTEGEKVLPQKVSLLYSLPQNTNIVGGTNQWTDKALKIYKSEISEDNLIATLNGSLISSNTGLSWDLSQISFEPSTEYIAYREKGVGFLFDSENKRLPEWTNEETKIRFSTPSVEEAGYAPMELGKPTLRGGSTVVNDGDIFSSIDRIEIAAPNLKYEYDGIKGGFFSDDASKKKGFLYDITDKEPVLVKEFLIDTQNRETATEYYNILCLFVNNILYEGREYRIVMPEGAFTIGSQRLWNYVRTPEFSITVKGATPTEVRLLGTSIADGAECSSLSDVIFNFNGDLAFDKDAVGTLRRYDASGKMDDIVTVPLTAHKEGADNITMVSAHVSYRTNGNPRILKKGCSYTLTIPAGCLYVESTPEIANKETVLNIKGVEAPPVITEPEYVSYTVAYMNPLDNVDTDAKYNSEDYTVAYSSSNDVVKGKSITLKFDTDAWKVVHLVRFNGDATTGTDLWEYAETGIYTSSPLNDKARFEVVMSYKDNLVFSNISTGIAELEDLKVRVYSSGDNIVIDGLTGGEHITVYTATGIVIGTHDAAASYDTVNISAPTGQAYIVRIQRGNEVQAAKIMH